MVKMTRDPDAHKNGTTSRSAAYHADAIPDNCTVGFLYDRGVLCWALVLPMVVIDLVRQLSAPFPT